MTSQHDQPGRIEASGIPPPLGGNEQDQLAAIAQSEFHNRRRRDSLIRYDLFAEPAWDMLLDLYIEQHRGQPVRSEEHTSELQSLMRISYAVFCLKKTNTK